MCAATIRLPLGTLTVVTNCDLDIGCHTKKEHIQNDVEVDARVREDGQEASGFQEPSPL